MRLTDDMKRRLAEKAWDEANRGELTDWEADKSEVESADERITMTITLSVWMSLEDIGEEVEPE